MTSHWKDWAKLYDEANSDLVQKVRDGANAQRLLFYKQIQEWIDAGLEPLDEIERLLAIRREQAK